MYHWEISYMSKLYSLCFALLTAIAISALSFIPSVIAQESDVKAAYAAWDAAFKKGDAKAIAAFYASDALLLPPDHTVVRGTDGVEKFFVGVLGTGATNHKLELIEARGNGKLLYASAKWTADGKDKAGKDQPWAGVATHVFEKQSDGKLRIKLHTFN
jgi:uncharacterized protein (TIGR02246 family)